VWPGAKPLSGIGSVTSGATVDLFVISHRRRMEEDYAHMKRLGRTLGFSFVLCLLAAMVAFGQPAPTGSDRIMISVTDADVQDVIHMLMRGYQVPVAMSADVHGRVTLHMTDAPIEQVLNAICELSGLEWRKSGGVYLIKPMPVSAPASIVERTNPDSAAVLPVVPTTAVNPAPMVTPSLAPIPPPEPKPSVTRSIKLKYASARDIAYLFGTSPSPQNPAWFFQDRMFQPAPGGDANIRYGPYFERVATSGRPDNAYYITPLGQANQWSAPGSMQWLGPGNMMYPQLPPPPPPPTPTGPGGTTPTGTTGAAGGGGALSDLRPPGIEVLAAIEWLNLLIVRGDEDSIAELERIIREVLDVKPKQVTIEAQFLEISTKEARALGIDWSFVSDDVSISTVGMAPAGNLAVRYTHGDFAAVLSALEDSSTGQVINAPKVTTMNNFPATLVIEEDYPYFVTTVVPGGFGTSSFPVRRLEMAPVTTGLSIVPRINEDDSITTLIQPQVSDIIKLVTDPELGEVPQISTRSLTTMLRVNDGETIVMGGLVTRKTSTAVTRVPILSKIPILGPLLFERRSTSLDDTQLLIFLTPRVLHEEEEMVPTPGALPGA
jgi:general secretion pathway protein D